MGFFISINIINVKHGLSHSVSSLDILRDISLQVEKNKIIGLIGPNGSGKTLLKHIYRVLPSPKKVVFINRKEIESYTYRELALQVTVMRQENALILIIPYWKWC